ncbi:cytochrome-c peroxidase [Rosistilla carotiformis]|nr:cytochrome-c peroxidase [Rosistilla carotiformis]
MNTVPLPVRAVMSSISTEPITPLLENRNLPAGKVELGRRLFHDKRLSADNSISCASCHDFAQGGSDGLETAIGYKNQRGPLNTPTVFNCSLSLAQFWDGRVASLEQQVSGPVHNPIEMATNWPDVITKLKRDKAFQRAFVKKYPRGFTEATIVDAIATFEKSLLTLHSPFDRYLLGDPSAISDDAADGYQLFKNLGCISCHQGSAVGGNMFQKFGVMEDYFCGEEANALTNKGRFNVTKRKSDLHRFKVPTLRNIALTAPYFHHGKTKTLREAIAIMAEHQLGTDLDETEIALIEAFLISLTGQIKKEWE